MIMTEESESLQDQDLEIENIRKKIRRALLISTREGAAHHLDHQDLQANVLEDHLHLADTETDHLKMTKATSSEMKDTRSLVRKCMMMSNSAKFTMDALQKFMTMAVLLLLRISDVEWKASFIFLI